MSILLEKLNERIPAWRKDVRSLVSESGSSVISEVTLKQAYGGMRGVKGLVCDTSSVSGDTGLIIRGNPLVDIIEIIQRKLFIYY